ADENKQAVLEADQVPEVDGQPRRPGDEPGDPNALDVRDCGSSSDSREIPLVAVTECAVCAPSEPRADDGGGVSPLLHRDGCETWQHYRLPGRIADADHVADREDVWAP